MITFVRLIFWMTGLYWTTLCGPPSYPAATIPTPTVWVFSVICTKTFRVAMLPATQFFAPLHSLWLMRHDNLNHLHGFPWLYILLKKWERVHENRCGNMNNISRQEPWMWSCALLPNEEDEDSGELSAIPYYYQNSVKLWQTLAKGWSTFCFIFTIIIIEQTCGRPRVFGGDLDDFFEATRELIPPVVKSCIDTIRRLFFSRMILI